MHNYNTVHVNHPKFIKLKEIPSSFFFWIVHFKAWQNDYTTAPSFWLNFDSSLPATGAEVIVMGWGLTYGKNQQLQSSQLLQVSIEVISNDTCSSSKRFTVTYWLVPRPNIKRYGMRHWYPGVNRSHFEWRLFEFKREHCFLLTCTKGKYISIWYPLPLVKVKTVVKATLEGHWFFPEMIFEAIFLSWWWAGDMDGLYPDSQEYHCSQEHTKQPSFIFRLQRIGKQPKL